MNTQRDDHCISLIAKKSNLNFRDRSLFMGLGGGGGGLVGFGGV